MAVNLSFIGGAGWQFFDDNGDPLSGGKIYTYAAGTTTPLTTYTSRDGLTPNTNPVILDAAGRTPQEIWATEGLLYKYVVKTSADVLIRSWDNVGGSVVASDLAQNLADTTDNAKGDALVGFRQSNTAGFLADATARTVNSKLQEYVSVKDFGAVGNGVVDDTVAVQNAVNFCVNNPGYDLHFPRGAYRVTTSINCTYSGIASGLTSGYYGFSVTGEDQINTYIQGETSNTPVWDLTGKTRMTFRNIGFANYVNSATNPSCFILLARNLTNGFAGGHVFDRVNFRGYCTQTGVQCASSEVNKFINVDFETFLAGASALELTEQIETTVNSSYINLSGHTFSGGNTRQLFIGCAFNGSLASGTHFVRCSGIDNSTFLSCYSNFASGEAEFLFSGSCSNITFIDHRSEGAADYCIRLAAGVTLNGLSFTGRTSCPFRGEDNSTFSQCNIRSPFIAGGTSFSFDAWDAIECDIYTLTNGASVRNSARGTRFWGFNTAGSLSLPTGNLTQPEFYGLSYTGGAANYRRRNYTTSIWERSRVGRQEITTLVLPETHVSDLSAATYPSGYTPDLNVGTNFSFILVGNATINTPTNVDLAPGDPKGQILLLSFSQDATGGHTVTFSSAYDLQGATIPTGASARISLMFVYTSTSAGLRWLRVN